MTEDQQIVNAKEEIPASQRKRGRPSGDEQSFPRDSLTKTLKLAESIEKNNAGKPFDRLILAKSTDYSPNSGSFRQLITSSSKYGLTEGGYQAEKISLTPLGSSIVAPTSDDEKTRGLLNALTNSPLMKTILEFYNKKQIPREELLKNSLKREFKVSSEYVDACYDVLMKNIEDFNLIEDIKGNKYLNLNYLETLSTEIESGLDTTHEETPDNDTSLEEPTSSKKTEEEKTKRIFVAHGKNRKPLEQLKNILDQFNVPYKIAIDEANQGRPISQKVSELMRECTSAIFLFTKDEETKDLEGNTVYRPSDNVVYELGAASVLYGNKIVIFKQEGVSFGSDFKDLGYISFDDDKLDAKAMDLMKELVGFGLLKVSAT